MYGEIKKGKKMKILYLNENSIKLIKAIELLEMVHEGSPFLDKTKTQGFNKFLHPLDNIMVKNARSAYANELRKLRRQKQTSNEIIDLQRHLGRTPSQRALNHNIEVNRNLEAARAVPDTFVGTNFSTKAAKATYERQLKEQREKQQEKKAERAKNAISFTNKTINSLKNSYDSSMMNQATSSIMKAGDMVAQPVFAMNHLGGLGKLM